MGLGAPAEVVLIDALGTLVGIEPPWPALLGLLAERHGIVVGEADVVRALRAEMAYYRTHCLRAGTPAALGRLREECAGVIAAELGGPVAALAPEELVPTLLDALRFRAYPDVVGALRHLRAGRARVIVVSNWDISLHDALEQAGLTGLLDGVVCSAAVGVAKPAAAIFAAALALAEVGPDRALHVGDRYDEDVLGARRAGIEPVLLVRSSAGADGLLGGEPPSEPPPGVRAISSLGELVDP